MRRTPRVWSLGLAALAAVTMAAPLAAQRPATLSVAVMYDHVVGGSLYGVAAQSSLLPLGRIGGRGLSLGGRAFVARGARPTGADHGPAHWGIAPVVFLSLGPARSATRAHLFLGLGYSHYSRAPVALFPEQEPLGDQVSSGLSSQSGLILEQDVAPGWGINGALTLHDQPIGSRRETAVQFALGVQIR